MISTRIVCRTFVGRADELEHLLQRRRQAGDGRGGLVLVGGEPGIGKSRLVNELRGRLNRHSSFVVSSACREFAQKPLGPLLEILERIAQVRGAESPTSSKGEWLDLISAALQRAAAKRTSVAILEDLHWADLDLIQTLSILVRRAANERLLFVATYRDNEISPEHPLFKWFGQLLREPATSLITLRKFDDRELERLMASALADNAELTPRVLRAVRDRSDGNPLFAEELLRSAVDSQRAGLREPSRALPLTLHALVVERLQNCSERARTLLRQASLFGRSFEVGRLCEIFGGDRVKLESIVTALCDLQLIDAMDSARGIHRFRHALTRDVVYSEIPADTLGPLHLAIAECLERSADASDVAEVLGYHFWEADRKQRAAGYYECAGDSAIKDFAYSEAAEFYQRAADGFANDRPARARLLARAAQALIFSGDLDGGLGLYECAVSLALELGDVAQVVRNRALMAGHLFDGGRREAAIALLRKTLPAAERGDVSLHARLRTRLAMTLARDERVDEAWDALGEIHVSRLEPQAECTGEYFLCASELHALRSEIDEWKTNFAKGAAIYEALGHPGPLHVAHSNFAVQSLYLGETALARTHHRIAGEFARTLHFDDQPIFQAQVEFFAGNLDEARRGVDAMAPSSRFLIRAISAQVAIPLAIALGDDRMLEKHLDEQLFLEAGTQPLTATMARVTAAHAMALSTLNRRAEARMLASRVLQSVKNAFGMMLPVIAIATLLPERAAELHPMLERAAAPAHDRVGKALLALLDSVVASRQEESNSSRDSAREGAHRFAEIGWPLFEAYCLNLAGDRHAALEIYRRCGAAGDLRRLEFAAPAGAEATSLGVLTRRERELALQIASGKPNRTIAAELSIGEKTVEKYLTSIYAKLGLSSRAQLAALVARLQNRAE